MNNPVLELRGVAREYEQGGQALSVLRGVNLALHAGESVALLGPSGSGKTTLLQIAGLLDTPTRGQVRISGRDMSAAGDAERTLARREYLGFVYQLHHLLPEFTALENVVLPQLIAGTNRGEAETRAKELLAAMGLSARVHHRPAALSGGERQRVAIVRALAANAKLVLADEPTGNLDPHTGREVSDFLLTLAREQGLALLVATHNMELAARMNRVVQLREGVLIEGTGA